MDILKHSGSNLGHFTRLRIAKIQDVEEFEINFQKKILKPIGFKTGKAISHIYVTDKTLQPSCDQLNKNGIYYLNQIKAYIPKHRVDVWQALEEMANDQVICICTDSDGNDWVFGNLEEPMELNFKIPLTVRNGYNITITGESLNPAILYDPI